MADAKNEKIKTPAVSLQLADGRLVEIVYSRETNRTKFAIFDEEKFDYCDEITLESGEILYPVSASNNLIKHKAVLLPEKPEEYGSTAELVKAIQEYLYRYIDLSDQFRAISSYYVLLTWLYDAFNELPYLRFRGDFGCGKTRALKIIGAISYKPFFASGASTVSPIFHVLDTFRGTLIFDEADFRFSDEKAELTKIFNQGHSKGFPILRTAITIKKEFDPRAFNVFSPKIVAMRRSFEDQALESRFLTEEMGQRSLRKDIPINLPDIQEDEALSLRNRLLMYRFQNLGKAKIDESLVDHSLSPRLNQILVPLLSIIADEQLMYELKESVRSFETELYTERSFTSEGNILEVIAELFEDNTLPNIPISAITKSVVSKFGEDYDHPISNRFIGGIIRKRLRLFTMKSNGVYVLPATEKSKVVQLCVRFGLTKTAPVQAEENLLSKRL